MVLHGTGLRRLEGTTLRVLDQAAAESPVRLCVVHQEPTWVVVEKPAGLPSVPGRPLELKDSVQSRARLVWPDAEGPITVHRLDIETSGLMLLALRPEMQAGLSVQFMQRRVGKEYVAVLDGEVEEETGTIDLPLIVDWPNRPKQRVDYAEGKPARTKYRVVERAHGRTRIRFRPLTGRSHQLRVHAATPKEQGGLGCPILGDSLYGELESAPRLLLHAAFLACWAPDVPKGETSRWMQFHSEPPF